jgi:hypothetical protein
LDLEAWEKMSQEEKDNAIRRADREMTEYDHARVEAMRCPKCGSLNTGRVHTEEQKRKLQEMKDRYLRKEGGKHEKERDVHAN